MIKAIFMGILTLIVGLFLINYVILPGASVLLARPDIDSWTGLGTGLHLLGLLLLGALYFGVMRGIVKSGRSDE